MAKACKACAAAIKGTKKMAKSRKSSKKSLLMQGAAITGGLLAGAVLVPKIVETIDSKGTFDNKMVNGGTIAVGILGAFNTKGPIQTGFLAMAGGAAANLLSEVVGMGYVINPNTNLENIVGYGEGNAPDSRYNAGEL